MQSLGFALKKPVVLGGTFAHCLTVDYGDNYTEVLSC